MSSGRRKHRKELNCLREFKAVKEHEALEAEVNVIADKFNTLDNADIEVVKTRVLNNEITNVYRSGIYLSNAKDVTISGNKINGVATDDAITNIGILLNTVENVKIDGNTITDLQNLPDSSGIKILENAGENITCTDNVFNLADGVVQIDDQRN